MGVFTVRVEIGDPNGGRFQAVEALVDTGASYTALPASLLRDLGVAPAEQRPFILADGRQVQLDMGQTWLRFDGRARVTPVVFADEGTRPLLGAVTLEEFGLGIDPVAQKLIPVPGYLMSSESA